MARGVSTFAFPSPFALDAMRFSTDPQLQLIRVYGLCSAEFVSKEPGHARCCRREQQQACSASTADRPSASSSFTGAVTKQAARCGASGSRSKDSRSRRCAPGR